MHVARITNDPAVMGGRPCILQAYPQLEPHDMKEALAYACAELP